MKQHLNKEKATESRSAANRVSTNSQPIQTKSIPGGVIQLGKKKNAIKRAKDQKGGVKHHIRPEYQDENEKHSDHNICHRDEVRLITVVSRCPS